jgi:hypothetical protein
MKGLDSVTFTAQKGGELREVGHRGCGCWEIGWKVQVFGMMCVMTCNGRKEKNKKEKKVAGCARREIGLAGPIGFLIFVLLYSFY